MKINSVTEIQSNEIQITNRIYCANRSAEQRARNVIPRRAKITETQVEVVCKSEETKERRERRVTI